MGLITKPYTFSSGGTIVAAEHNDNFDTVYTLVNGNISTANISSSAGIVDTQLAQITTANKVNLSALRITSQAAGDIIYASDATTLARLATGTGYLKGGAAPAYSTIVGAPGTYHVSATGDDTTTNTSYEDMDSMSITFTPSHASNPILVLFNASGEHNANSSTPSNYILHTGSTVAATERELSATDAGSGGSIVSCMTIVHYCTLAASSQTIKVQFKTNAGVTFTVHERSLTVIEFKQN